MHNCCNFSFNESFYNSQNTNNEHYIQTAFWHAYEMKNFKPLDSHIHLQQNRTM